VRLEPIRHTLQQAIARVPPEGHHDDAQVGDIEHRYLKTRRRQCRASAAGLRRSQKQRALGKARQRLEIGQKVDRVLLVNGTAGRRTSVGGDLLEQQQFILTNKTVLPRCRKEGPTGVLSNSQAAETASERTACATSASRPCMTEEVLESCRYRFAGAESPAP